MQTDGEVLTLLIAFFRDEFAADPGGVGDWFAQGGDDIDGFVAYLDKNFPRVPQSKSGD